MPTHIFKLKVLTPIFMGGADPQGEPELRAASIRGAMRFWFRAMAGTVTTDPREIYRLESEIFGNTERKSKVVVRVAYNRPHVSSSLLVLPRDPSKDKRIKPLPPSLAYLANMGLVKYFGKNELPNNSDKPRRGFYWSRSGFSRNFKFYIHIYSNSPEILRITKNTLIIAIYLGGFGARWRHGFGSCEIIDDRSRQPLEISLEETFKDLSDSIFELARNLKLKLNQKDENFPEFPSFKDNFVEIWEGFLTKDSRDWESMLALLGKKYFKFRRRGGDDTGPYGHSWDFNKIVNPILNGNPPEQNFAINSIFGVPIQYQRHKDRKREILEVKAKREEIGRRASPLIIHLEPEKRLIRATIFKSLFIPHDAHITIQRFKLRTPSKADFRRIELFLKSLGLTRRYPNA